MDLKILNDEYTRLKTELEAEKVNVERLKTKVERTSTKLENKRVQKEKAVTAGNTAKVTTLDAEINTLKGELKTFRKDAIAKQELVTRLQAAIDDKYKQLQANPELKKHLDEVVVKKYSRQLAKHQKEKADKERENEKLYLSKDRLQQLSTIVKSDEDLRKYLTGLLVAKRNLMEYEDELRSLEVTPRTTPPTYTNPARANDLKINLIPTAQAKISANEKLFRKKISRHGVTIKDEDIEVLYKNGLVKDSTGKLNLNGTLKEGINSIDRRCKQNIKEIKGIDKRITDHQTVLGKHSTHTPATPASPASPASPAVKPNWWQFIKRFNNWNEQRKLAKLPPPTTPLPATPVTSTNSFKDSMKYNIVQDFVDNIQKEERKAAKQERTTGGR